MFREFLQDRLKSDTSRFQEVVMVVVQVHFADTHHISVVCVNDTTKDQFHWIRHNCVDIRNHD